MNDYPYDACPNCGSEVDETELYVFCTNEDCGWSEELPDDPRWFDSPEDDLLEEDAVEGEEGE